MHLPIASCYLFGQAMHNGLQLEAKILFFISSKIRICPPLNQPQVKIIGWPTSDHTSDLFIALGKILRIFQIMRSTVRNAIDNFYFTLRVIFVWTVSPQIRIGIVVTIFAAPHLPEI